MKIICRVCRSVDIMLFGKTFCYVNNLKLGSIRERILFKCNQCKSITVDPIPSQDELSLYYNRYAIEGASDLSSNKRKSLPIIQQLANLLGRGKVLDIGCGNGDVLASLPSSFKKFGIDIALVACNKAKQKDIEVFCSTWELVDFTTEFDLVIALDFLEHVDDVSKALQKIGRVLRRGGYVVIETGNADSWAAKTLGEDWSYSAVYGHLQILSPGALVSLAHQAQIEAISLRKGHHSSARLGHIVYRAMLAYGFHLTKQAWSALRPVFGDLQAMRKLYHRSPPAAMLGDNMILVGRKQGLQNFR